MRRFIYHLVRLVPAFVITAVFVWLAYIKWSEGKHIGAGVKILTGVCSSIVLANWLYSGTFLRKSLVAYISRYRNRRFFRRDIRPLLVGYPCGVAIVMLIMLISGKEKSLADPMFYLLMCGFCAILGILHFLIGYIKYCYQKN